MTEHTASPEYRLDLPEDWTGLLLPRRGKRTGEPVVLDPEAPKRVRGLIKWHQDELRAAFALSDNQPYAPAALRHLDSVLNDSVSTGSTPDPAGAGAIAAVLLSSEKRYRSGNLRPELDAWYLEHGLAFAVGALIELTSLNPWPNSWHRTRDDSVAERRLRDSTRSQLSYLHTELRHGIAAARGLIATAPEPDYEAAVAEAATHRGDPTRRLLTSLLFPERADWAAEVAAEHDNGMDDYAAVLMWYLLEDPAHLAAARLTKFADWWISDLLVANTLAGLGAAAYPVFAATIRQHPDAESRQRLYRALALTPSDEAAAFLFSRLDEQFTLPAAETAIARAPQRALRVIAGLSASAAPELRPRFAALAAKAPETALAALDVGDRAAIESLLKPAGLPEAAPEALPPLLVTPPWTVKRPKRKAVTIDGLEASSDLDLVWAEGEEEACAVPGASYFSRFTEENWRQRARSLGTRDRGYMLCAILAYAPKEIAETVVDRWEGTTSTYEADDCKTILARFGPRVVPGVIETLRANPAYHEALVPIRSVEAARLAADWFARLKTARAGAVAWVDRHGPEGVSLLVPDALGADRKARQSAEGLLVLAAMRHGAAAVTAAAEHYGPEATAAIAALVDGDPLEPRGVKVPKLPAWVDPAMLPPVTLADGTAVLPPEAVKHLVTVLALTSPDYPYAGFDVAVAACDPASLTRFSRALFQLWLSSGGTSKDGWALTQLAHFADDDTVRLLAPKVREWPGQSQHKRAVTGLGVLGAIGSETALRAVQGIADKVKFKALKVEAGVQIAAIAAELGLTRDQLADRLVPDFGLAGEAALTLDYGPRSFTVRFDEQLKPYVTDADGKPRKSLPKPGAKDDAALAEPAYQRFTLLKKELRSTSADQVARLEKAMAQARTWTVEEFERFFARHPLVKHLARRLVWTAEADGTRTGFRIAEDGTYAGAADDDFDLPEHATVRIAHPFHMQPKEIDAWSEILADYEILQPFEQLTRPVMAFTDAELTDGHLARFEGVEVEVGRLLGLTKHGWHRGAPEDGGVEPGIAYAIPGGGYVTVALEPGIWVGMIAENPIQKLVGVRLADQEDYYWHGTAKDTQPRPPEVDPLIASEILTALARVTGRG
ncbi:DUF4132 domain-containing protein [Glycomyces sp. NPDC046736]|uniref:DUF4132 domain-containing protein n=1 Tax=Glycomyces sp. NPDC046736 TaxID=3155615 RepID=UPI0033C8A8C6